jgi:ornithine decarboxylase (EC 4.1.1.17)
MALQRRVTVIPYTSRLFRYLAGHGTVARRLHMKFRFPIIIIDEDYRSENTSGLGIRALAQAIEAEGFEVVGVTSYGDLSQFAQQQSRASAFILSIDDEEFTANEGLDPIVLSLRSFIGEVRRKNTEVPIYVHGETKTSRHLPNDILRELHGFIHMFEDTPEFVAKHIIREAKSYLESVQPPFFKALLDYAEDGSYSWHCPGHSGGVAFLKSPVGQMYHQFYGENMLRADVCNAVEELGQLLDHNGAIGESERNAARIFNCRPLLLCDQRHVHIEQDGVAPHRGTRRRGGGRPQLPQVHPAQHHHDRGDSCVHEAHAQPLRHHRADPAKRVRARGHPGQDQGQPAAQGRGCQEGQAARAHAHAVHLRRRALQHRNHQEHARWLRGQPAL